MLSIHYKPADPNGAIGIEPLTELSSSFCATVKQKQQPTGAEESFAGSSIPVAPILGRCPWQEHVSFPSCQALPSRNGVQVGAFHWLTPTPTQARMHTYTHPHGYAGPHAGTCNTHAHTYTPMHTCTHMITIMMIHQPTPT
jgi:hypothetical protein